MLGKYTEKYFTFNFHKLKFKLFKIISNIGEKACCKPAGKKKKKKKKLRLQCLFAFSNNPIMLFSFGSKTTNDFFLNQ